MTDTKDLLNQLRVDRHEPPPRKRTWIGGVILAAVAMGAAWFALGARTAQPSAPVAVAIATPAPVAARASSGTVLEANGFVVARRMATVSAKTTGRVVEVLVEEGQLVQKGQILARLDDSNTRAMFAQAQAQVEQARAAFDAARISFEDAQRTYRRSEKLHAQGLASDDAFDNVRMTYNTVASARAVAQRAEAVAVASLAVSRQSQDDTVMRAPFSGVVTVKAAQAGDMVSPVSAGGGFTRTGICTIVDMSSLAVDVDVSEKFISRVIPGQRAEVTLNAYPGWKIPAEVLAVIPTADRAKATVRVRLGFQQVDPRILPEMGVRVVLLQP